MTAQPHSTHSELHHRYHEQLAQYWRSLRGDRPYPREDEIDPDEVAELWPSCFLISNDEVTQRIGYRYSYLGKELIEAYGEDANSPDIVMKLISTANQPTTHKFDEVIKTGQPIIDESEFVNLRHLLVKYRTCLLPLGYDGKVTHILGCMRWKAY